MLRILYHKYWSSFLLYSPFSLSEDIEKIKFNVFNLFLKNILFFPIIFLKIQKNFAFPSKFDLLSIYFSFFLVTYNIWFFSIFPCISFFFFVNQAAVMWQMLIFRITYVHAYLHVHTQSVIYVYYNVMMTVIIIMIITTILSLLWLSLYL